MDANHVLRKTAGEKDRDPVSPITALRTKSGVTQHSCHQRVPQSCRRWRADGLSGLGREAEAGNGRDNNIECVIWRSAIFLRITQGPDGFDEFEHGTRPAMG